MAYDVVKFVDSIASSPTTRLDVNDGAQWTVRDFQAPPPRLRRSAVSNAMTDGAYVSSSSYDARTLFIEIDLITTTQDTGATELQKLARELDRSTNYLMYQPNALTKPVFFKTWRSDFADVVDVRVVGAYRRLSIELLAEPFALGLRETISVGTVNNDPAAASNGCYFDVTGVIGDVAAPAVIVDSGSVNGDLIVAVRQHDTPSDATRFVQAESLTLGTDTTNPGGGPDAAMSGTGTNNYVRTSFATATMMARLTWSPALSDAAANAMRGTYRLYVVLRRTATASALTVRAAYGAGGSYSYTDTVTLAATTNRQMVDLGVVSFGMIDRPGGVASPAPPTVYLEVQAARSGGADSLDWDYIHLFPADESMMIYTGDSPTTSDLVIDSALECCYSIENGGNAFDGTGSVTYSGAPVTGGFPYLVPNQTNRFTYVKPDFLSTAIDKTLTGTVSVNYWPRYLYVRPSAT